MPRRSTLTLIFGLALSLPSLARADLKVGYVDLQRALIEVEEGREAKRRLQAKLDVKQKELDREQEALRKEKEVLDKQASMMSEETRTQKQIDLQKRLFELAQKWEKGKQEMATQERTELQAIFQKMDPIISDIAQREGLTLVFDKTDSGLVYAPPSLDLTNELVRLYNDRNKGPSKPKGETPKAEAPKKPDASKK